MWHFDVKNRASMSIFFTIFTLLLLLFWNIKSQQTQSCCYTISTWLCHAPEDPPPSTGQWTDIIKSLHMDVYCRWQYKFVWVFSKNCQNSNFHCRSWISHEKYNHIGTNKPTFGSVFLRITPLIWESIVKIQLSTQELQHGPLPHAL